MSSYPYSQLTDGETVLVHEHPHWKMLILPGMALTLILTGCGCLAALVADTGMRQVVWIALGVAAGIATLWFGLAPWLRWYTTHLVVTSEKVMFREGIVTRAGLSIPLSRISSVRTEVDLNDRLFGCGSLIIEAYSEQPLRFPDIPAVEHTQHLIYKAVEGDTHDLIPVTPGA